MMRRLFALYRNIFRKERVNQELEEERRSYIELVAGEKFVAARIAKKSCTIPAGTSHISNRSKKAFVISELELPWTFFYKTFVTAFECSREIPASRS